MLDRKGDWKVWGRGWGGGFRRLGAYEAEKGCVLRRWSILMSGIGEMGVLVSSLRGLPMRLGGRG